MVELGENVLFFRFPNVHPEARLLVGFTRTLKTPDDGKYHPQPPSFGRLCLRHVDDFAEKLPVSWQEHGGVMMPIRSNEAMSIQFYSQPLPYSDTPYPFAVKVATGKVNALDGSQWNEDLIEAGQDYLVTPPQNDLGGYCTKKGEIRQFVAACLGEGKTLEERLGGVDLHGGIQLAVYPMKAAAFARLFPPATGRAAGRVREAAPEFSAQMGLDAGGPLRRYIFKDPYGADDWDTDYKSRVFVHLADADSWTGITGAKPHGDALKAGEYDKALLPWFEGVKAVRVLPGSQALAEASARKTGR